MLWYSENGINLQWKSFLLLVYLENCDFKITDLHHFIFLYFLSPPVTDSLFKNEFPLYTRAEGICVLQYLKIGKQWNLKLSYHILHKDKQRILIMWWNNQLFSSKFVRITTNCLYEKWPCVLQLTAFTSGLAQDSISLRTDSLPYSLLHNQALSRNRTPWSCIFIAVKLWWSLQSNFIILWKCGNIRNVSSV